MPIYDYGTVVADLVHLHETADQTWPAHFGQGDATRRGTEFDANAYFRALTHLAVPEGQVLDYVYASFNSGGFPLLHLRPRDEPRFLTYQAYADAVGGEEALPEAREQLPSVLRLDGTPESFFELVLFAVLAGQFYLSWHAGYHDAKVVTAPEALERILAEPAKRDFGSPFSEEQQRQARALALTPSVTFLDDNTAEVSVVLFSKWGGFKRVTQTVSRAYPHTLAPPDIVPLVEYDCGVKY